MEKSVEIQKKAMAASKKPSKQNKSLIQRLRAEHSKLGRHLAAGPRTVGVFASGKAARKAVRKSGRELHEAHYFSRLLIERRPCGLWHTPTKETWYALQNDGTYKRATRPKQLNGLVGFA